jgi:hypothetical protein
MNYGANDYRHMVNIRTTAFQAIARKLGKDHSITKMMGTLAWGRFKCEGGPSGGLREAVEAKGFLDGSFDILNLWARDNDSKAQRIMLEIYPSGYKSMSKPRDSTVTEAPGQMNKSGSTAK